jgi:hypothetical protein
MPGYLFQASSVQVFLVALSHAGRAVLTRACSHIIQSVKVARTCADLNSYNRNVKCLYSVDFARLLDKKSCEIFFKI